MADDRHIASSVDDVISGRRDLPKTSLQAAFLSPIVRSHSPERIQLDSSVIYDILVYSAQQRCLMVLRYMNLILTLRWPHADFSYTVLKPDYANSSFSKTVRRVR